MDKKPEQASDEIDIPDIGGVLTDIDLSLFDILPKETERETRYIKPKILQGKKGFVRYDNAVKLAKDLYLDKGERYDCLVSGNFIFGDLIEAYLVQHRAKALKMTISTLSLSQNNVDSLANLLNAGYVDELQLIVSTYFYGNEVNSLIPYIYKNLDTGGKFQLAIAGTHTKTAQFETLGGRKIVMHGSANLRSSGNIEQFTIEENAELYDFYDDIFSKIAEKYATIQKMVRGSALWDTVNKKTFKNENDYVKRK